MANGNTNGPMDEDHDDTSYPWPPIAKRILFEKKVINATAGNLFGAVLRPVCIYGNSYVHNYIVACKNSNKIVAGKANNANCFVNREDLADMFRIVMENRACGLFLASEPEPVYIDDLVEKLSQVLGIQNIERVEDISPYMSAYGAYLFGQTFNQIYVPKRLKDLYGYTARHKFLDWLETQHF
ncbi:unnamed protein product [Blepharisma stoltei]|uniref:Uncharacterized protein n=1 Tax=Blepharisma stoltei TaxID=1481888 RepID=A0AAU9JG95_9CILI|nr:unnamed protein product [Blepharisma stoltei]